MRLELLRVRGVMVLAALLAAALPGYAAQATLVADAHVNSGRPTANSGAISNLNVGGGYTALLQFDLSMLPSGTTPAQVTRAVLLVFCNRVTVPGSVAVQPVNGAWGEYSVTSATLPALGTAAQTFPVSQAGAFVPVDVTALVQGWLTTPSSNNGVALTSTAANVQFDSKENDQTGHAAMLDITLAANGPAGPAGPQGPQGPSGVPGPQGAAGLQGVPGPAGAQGPSGPAGATGAMGPQGVAGPVGLNFQGAYSATVSYNLGDGVLYGGAGYVSLAAGNRGNTPNLTPGKWSEFASGGAGPAGPAGPQGPSGPQGPIGPAGPAGATGAAGPQGAAGAGIKYRGAWSSGVSYAVNDAVTLGGSTYLAQTANTSQQPNLFPVSWAVMAQAGATGPSGPTGIAGAAATVSVGSVTTGAPGSQASVTNSGSSAAAVLNFTIPQGQPGTGGAAGASGTDVSAAAVYHAVSNSYLFYSVTSGNFSGGSDAAQVLTWVPNGCTATKLQVYSQQGQTITVALRQGSLGSMTDTPLVCTITPNSACVVSGNVFVAPGTFIDFHALGANVTPSPVWTALDCH